MAAHLRRGLIDIVTDVGQDEVFAEHLKRAVILLTDFRFNRVHQPENPSMIRELE
jgi:hypothetical protein